MTNLKQMQMKEVKKKQQKKQHNCMVSVLSALDITFASFSSSKKYLWLESVRQGYIFMADVPSFTITSSRTASMHSFTSSESAVGPFVLAEIQDARREAAVALSRSAPDCTG